MYQPFLHIVFWGIVAPGGARTFLLAASEHPSVPGARISGDIFTPLETDMQPENQTVEEEKSFSISLLLLGNLLEIIHWKICRVFSSHICVARLPRNLGKQSDSLIDINKPPTAMITIDDLLIDLTLSPSLLVGWSNSKISTHAWYQRFFSLTIARLLIFGWDWQKKQIEKGTQEAGQLGGRVCVCERMVHPCNHSSGIP